LNQHCGFDLQAPKIQPKIVQGSLFWSDGGRKKCITSKK
jgi:hypothetical protein